MCFLLKLLNMFSVEVTEYVFCSRYLMCFLLKVLNVFSVLNVSSVVGTECVFC